MYLLSVNQNIKYMGTNSKSEVNVKKNFVQAKLVKLNIEQKAYECGFYQGNIKKVTATNLMLSFFLMAMTCKNTYSQWAQYLSILLSGQVSKVSLWKRMNVSQVNYLRSVLEETFTVNMQTQYLSSYKSSSLFSPFSQVYLQDSTVISLPDELHQYYKGSVSKGKQKSSIRLQVIYSIFRGFKLFEISNFTDNDQKASGTILKFTRQGDLIIRDLGYHVLKVLGKIRLKKAYFLSRYHHATNVYDVNTKKEIDLLQMFSKSRPGIVDIEVLISKKEKLPCRLVAIKLPGHLAAERKRKAKNDRDKRLNHSPGYLKLLEWSIFITNVNPDVWGWKEVLQAYKARWYIETVFKGWKSHFNITHLVPAYPRKNRRKKKDLEKYKARVDAVIYMMLIFIVIFQIHFYCYWVYKIFEKYKRYVSLLKLCDFVSSNIHRVFSSNNIGEFEAEVAYYTCYEKRKKRANQFEMMFNALINN